MGEFDSTRYKRVGGLLVLVGLICGIDAMFRLQMVQKLWPLLITLLGSGFLGVYIKRNFRGVTYLAVGVFLLGFSLLALYCNFTSWTHMRFLWPLFLLFLGGAMISVFCVDRRSRITFFFGLVFISIGLSFLLMLTAGFNLWWISLILLGASTIITGEAT